MIRISHAIALLCLLFAVTAAVTGVLARPGPQWDSQDPDVKAWFNAVMQPGHENDTASSLSCCGEGDRVDVDIVAFDDASQSYTIIVTNGYDVIEDGHTFTGVNKKARLQTAYGNPLGKTIAFIAGGTVICLIPFMGT